MVNLSKELLRHMTVPELDEVINLAQQLRANLTDQDTRTYLEHEVSRLRECRDTWKKQAENQAALISQLRSTISRLRLGRKENGS